MPFHSIARLRRQAVAAVTRRYPFYSACGSLGSRRLVSWLAGTSGDVEVAPIWGDSVVLAPLSDYLGRAAYFTGDNDPKITWAISRILRPGDTVLDVGANIGMLTLPMARMVGPHGIVHAFEPNSAVANLLVRSAAQNDLTNIAHHPIALGDRNEQRTLHVPAGHGGAGTLLRSHAGAPVDRFQVNVCSLDSLADDLGLRTVRLLKIDVEGFEFPVLSGARAWLAAAPPFAIILEFDQPGPSPSDHPVIRLLRGLDYGFVSIPRRFLRPRGRRLVPETAAREEFSHDLVAAKLGPDLEEVLDLLRPTWGRDIFRSRGSRRRRAPSHAPLISDDAGILS